MWQQQLSKTHLVQAFFTRSCCAHVCLSLSDSCYSNGRLQRKTNNNNENPLRLIMMNSNFVVVVAAVGAGAGAVNAENFAHVVRFR